MKKIFYIGSAEGKKEFTKCLGLGAWRTEDEAKVMLKAYIEHLIKTSLDAPYKVTVKDGVYNLYISGGWARHVKRYKVIS